MARNRKTVNKGLPPNLYPGVNKHYKYRRPDDGKWRSMGTDRTKAVSAARQLNSLLMQGRELVEKVMNNNKQVIFKSFLDKFQSNIMKERELSPATIQDYERKIVHIREKMGEKAIDEISVLDIAEFLHQFPSVISNRYRSLLGLIFKYAVANGLCLENPAEKTIPRKISKKRRRLTLEAYQAIYENAPAWLKNAMDIALQTLQRREDVVKLKFTDIKEGFLYVIQGKTKKHGKAPTLE